jgi:hypothetical protein
VEHHVVRVAVQLLKRQTGRVAPVDLADGVAKHGPGLVGVLFREVFRREKKAGARWSQRRSDGGATSARARDDIGVATENENENAPERVDGWKIRGGIRGVVEGPRGGGEARGDVLGV